MRDKAGDGNRAWRRVGRRLLEIPMPVDRSADGDLGGRSLVGDELLESSLELVVAGEVFSFEHFQKFFPFLVKF